jgi:hypothetical protein
LPGPYNTRTATVEWTGPNNHYATALLAEPDGWYWGTDNNGLWHFAPDAPFGSRWQHFRAQDGLYDDSITALCRDRQGRLWVGTERRGVSVYNGKWWRNYDVMTGPLGVHVNAIAMEPSTGDIWIGTECGIAIYSERTKAWSYITRADGLVSDKITAIAFGAADRVYIGTASDGLITGVASTLPSSWHSLAASAEAALNETGDGLPSSQINCVIVNDAGKVFCGTAAGLATSTDNGSSWTYLHGWDWQDKARRGFRKGGKRPRIDDTRIPLADDVVTSLAFDKNGHLYVGHRQRGIEVYNDATGEQLYHTPFDAYGVFVKAIAPSPKRGVLTAEYGSGVTLSTWPDIETVPHSTAVTPVPAPVVATSKAKKPSKAPAPIYPDHPTPALAVISPQIRAVAVPKSPNGPVSAPGYFLGEDWMTQGNWIGRYGLDFVEFCAQDGRTDLELTTTPGYSVVPQLGNSTHPGEDVSHWLVWDSSGDPRVLHDPSTGVRRQGEWNDHGERYNMVYDGPDLWLKVAVPEGVHRMSMYFMNKDGHTRVTRFRDYIIELRQFVANVPVAATYGNDNALPIIAQTRVKDFWPGVYESFVVTGPSQYYVKLERNYSLNTILQGVFFDRLDITRDAWTPSWLYGVPLTPPPASVKKPVALKVSPAAVEAMKLWAQLDGLYGSSQTGAMQRPYRIQLLRVATQGGAPATVLAAWRRQLGLWADADWAEYNDFIVRERAAIPVKPKP